MADYVLVHGAFNDGRVWDAVKSLLLQKGHRVFCPTLSDPKTHDLSAHIAQVCALIEDEKLNSVILVGHSYAGMVITGVADRMPECIAYLVYVDAAVPENGQSLIGIIGNYAKYGLQPLEPFVEPLYFDENKIKNIPKTYIFCERSEFSEVSRKMFDRVKKCAQKDKWDYYTLDTTHKAMLTQPEKLADILLNVN